MFHGPFNQGYPPPLQAAQLQIVASIYFPVMLSFSNCYWLSPCFISLTSLQVQVTINLFKYIFSHLPRSARICILCFLNSCSLRLKSLSLHPFQNTIFSGHLMTLLCVFSEFIVSTFPFGHSASTCSLKDISQNPAQGSPFSISYSLAERYCPGVTLLNAPRL